MIVDVLVPSVGESIVEGVLGRWLADDGAAVEKGAPVFELETDKTTTEIPAPAGGVLRHGAKAGDTVKVGASVAKIDTEAKPSAAAPAAAAAAPAAAVAPGVKIPAPGTPPAAVSTPAPPAPKGAAAMAFTGPAPAAPKAEAPAAAPAAAPPAPQFTGERTVRRERMTRLRKTIADRMVEAQHTAAILSTFNEADMSAIVALRAKYKDSFKEKHGVGLGFMSFFVKACVSAIQSVPAINASIENDEIVYHDYCDFGIAVGGDRGLIVPVLRNVERLSFAEIEKAIAALAARAREGKIELSELQGGTFSISNVGTYGPLMGTPIINPPQSAILGMYAMKDRPVAVNGQVVIRPMMYLALSYDHRLLDGKDAVTFLVKVKEAVENPERLLLTV
jgi:2-oxoglutarate dehydrogenase E2 component (dihydrolipoamide succinyltransferase)